MSATSVNWAISKACLLGNGYPTVRTALEWVGHVGKHPLRHIATEAVYADTEARTRWATLVL